VIVIAVIGAGPLPLPSLSVICDYHYEIGIPTLSVVFWFQVRVFLW
jgi:hypothetical protein